MFVSSLLQGCRITTAISVYRSSSCEIARRMATGTGSDHLNRTATNTRQEIITAADVKELESLSGTVKRLKLDIQDKQFTFKAGQWVDMFIPGVDTVGGFSMCSAPDLLTTTGVLHLAVKFAQHPPAFWVHTKCKIGDKVQLRAGGDFFYDPKPDTDHSDILLLAGGVGINPLYSMLQHFVYLHPSRLKAAGDSRSSQEKRVSMLYSARNTEELIFKNDLITISNRFDNVNLKLYSTRESVTDTEYLTHGRIQMEDIQSALAKLEKRKTEVYICGPSSFIEAMESYCLESEISKDKVYYEKWW